MHTKCRAPFWKKKLGNLIAKCTRSLLHLKPKIKLIIINNHYIIIIYYNHNNHYIIINDHSNIINNIHIKKLLYKQLKTTNLLLIFIRIQFSVFDG